MAHGIEWERKKQLGTRLTIYVCTFGPDCAWCMAQAAERCIPSYVRTWTCAPSVIAQMVILCCSSFLTQQRKVKRERRRTNMYNYMFPAFSILAACNSQKALISTLFILSPAVSPSSILLLQRTAVHSERERESEGNNTKTANNPRLGWSIGYPDKGE
jgi:hypothetical protein